jgi:hypothetical protein
VTLKSIDFGWEPRALAPYIGSFALKIKIKKQNVGLLKIKKEGVLVYRIDNF